MHSISDDPCTCTQDLSNFHRGCFDCVGVWEGVYLSAFWAHYCAQAFWERPAGRDWILNLLRVGRLDGLVDRQGCNFSPGLENSRPSHLAPPLTANVCQTKYPSAGIWRALLCILQELKRCLIILERCCSPADLDHKVVELSKNPGWEELNHYEGDGMKVFF